VFVREELGLENLLKIEDLTGFITGTNRLNSYYGTGAR